MYLQVYQDENPHNSNKMHTNGANIMGPRGNMQGGFKFMTLRLMKNIARIYCDMIPITNTFIYRVRLLGKYQPELLLFTYRRGRIIQGGDIDITGVDGDENEASPLKIDN